MNTLKSSVSDNTQIYPRKDYGQKEAKYIKRYDAINNGLNTFCMLGKNCSHGRQKVQCIICSPATCDRCGKVYGGKNGLKQHQKKCQIVQSNISTDQSL